MYNYLRGVQPKLRDVLDDLYYGGGIPKIRGTWYYVDPTSGSSNGGGETPETACANIEDAYDLCTSGAGDGIIVLSAGTTSAGTTSYLTHTLTWSKHGITVVGVCAPTAIGQRARIASKTVTTGALTTIAFPTATTITDSAEGFVTAGFQVGDTLTIDTTSNTNDGTAIVTAVTAGQLTCSASTFTVETAATAGSTTIVNTIPSLITVSGSNNSFYNLLIANYDSNAASIGGVIVSGNRNSFSNVNILGATHATPGAVANAFDLKINGGEENSFYGCTIGTDTIIKAATNAPIAFDGGAWRTFFKDCDIISYSATSTHGAINSIDASSMSGYHVFARCRFMNWKPNGAAALASAFIGTAPTSGYIAIDSCSLFGFAAWDSVGGNNTVYIANSDATASGAGGIATTV